MGAAGGSCAGTTEPDRAQERPQLPMSVWTCISVESFSTSQHAAVRGAIRACRVGGEFLTASRTVEDGRLCVLRENVIRLSDVVLPKRDAVNRAVACDKSGDVGGHPRDNGPTWRKSRSSLPITTARPCASVTCS